MPKDLDQKALQTLKEAFELFQKQLDELVEFDSALFALLWGDSDVKFEGAKQDRFEQFTEENWDRVSEEVALMREQLAENQKQDELSQSKEDNTENFDFE